MKKIILMLVILSTNVYACLPNSDCSPPGNSWTYKKLDNIISVEKYDENFSWYSVKGDFNFSIVGNGSYLLPKEMNPYSIKLVEISRSEKWYCVKGIPGYCAPLRGMDGKLITERTNLQWPQSKD